MKRKQLQLVVALATLALVGLVGIQVFWFSKAFSIEARQFNEKANVVLRTVAHQLLLSQHDSTSAIQPITQTSSNSFFVRLTTSFDYATADSLLKGQLAAQNLPLAYQLAVYDTLTTQLSLGNYSLPPLANNTSGACLTRKQFQYYSSFSVTFPSKNRHLASQMGIWFVTAFTFLIVLLVFAYMVILMLRQKRLSEMKTEFMNNMTHELKSPITNLSVASEVLNNALVREDPVKLLKYTSIIQLESRRLQAQVERVLQIAALEKGEVALQLDRVDVNQLVQTIAETVGIAVQKRNGQVLTNLQAKTPNIMADKLHLSNMFYSLLDNAEKYSPQPPQISLSTRNHDKGILISITDEGIGMSAQTQQFIFEKFYRAPTGDVHEVKGFGLGLSYVQAIVKAHHGSICVKSTPNEGSVFEVYFQCA
ncbi:MAG: HAMP domain-containing sensor histidine kinase [Bacteroidota bacterium]